jgi:hypothetical protein
MDQFRFGTALLLVIQVGIGGWAFIELNRPESLLDFLRLLTLC